MAVLDRNRFVTNDLIGERQKALRLSNDYYWRIVLKNSTIEAEGDRWFISPWWVET